MFACNSYEVLGVDPAFIMHKLNVDPLLPPKKLRSRRSMKPHVEVVKKEVEKLKQSGAIKEVFFLEWLANTVVVKKKNGKWRVYVDFINLNCCVGSFFWKVPKSIDYKGYWASKDGWLDWVRFFAAYWGRYMNRLVRESHKAPHDSS